MSLLHFIIIIKSIILIIAPPSPQPSPAEEFIHDNLASLYRINNVLGLLISDNSKDALQACSNFLIYGREDDNYQNILLYTGHDFSYLGSPVDCGKSKNNYTYNILSFTRNLDETSDNYQKQLDVFLDLKQVIVGLCMWDDCVPEVEAIAQEEPDSKFYKTLTTYYGITKITNYNTLTTKRSYLATFSISFIIGYLILRILLNLICYLFIKNQDEELTSQSNAKNEDESFDEIGKLFKSKDQKKKDKKDSKKEGKDDTDDSNDYDGLSGIQIEENEESDEEEKGEKEKKENSVIKPIKEETPKEVNKSKEKEEQQQEDDEEEEEKEEENEDEDNEISGDSLFERNNDLSNIHNLEKYIAPANVNVVPAQNPLPQQQGGQMSSKVKANIPNITIRQRANLCMTSLRDGFLKKITTRQLFAKKTHLFNANSLEVISGIRGIIMLFMTFNEIFTVFVQNPTSGSPNTQFFRSILFSFVKLSCYAIYCWIYLDGLEYTYKILNGVKKDKSFKNFCKLFLRTVIPKFFVFMFIFFGVYYIGKEFISAIGETMLFEEYYNEKISPMYCIQNPISILFTPIFGYLGQRSSDFTNCFQFTYLFINEFNCIIILFLLLFFMYKFKSWVFDLIVTILVICNIGTYAFIFDVFTTFSSIYKLEYILGENISIQLPNLMFNLFFFGIISGVIYFYYVESMNELSTFVKQKYYPFSFAMKIMRGLIGGNLWIKLIFIILALAVIITQCLSFYIIMQRIEDQYTVVVKFSFLLKLYYEFESIIFILCFSVLILNLLFANDKLNIKLFFGNNVFFWFERVSFEYVILLEFVVMSIYSYFNQNGIYWDYLYIWYLTSFIFILILMISIFTTIMFDFPLRLLMIKLFKKKEKKRSIFSIDRTDKGLIK